MRAIAIPVLAFTAFMAMTNGTNAQNARSSVHQPDFSTCSNAHAACLTGVTRRGDSRAGCEKAYSTCMRTGVWDTYGLYGRRVTGIDRR